MPDDKPRKKPLAAESNFWHRVEEKGAMRKSDILRLREDLLRLEQQVQATAQGCAPANIIEELRSIRDVMAKDYGTQSLVIQTLLELLLEKGVITEDEFEDKLDEIDLRDGKKDGTFGGHEFRSGEGI
jgi:hypothetical protein